MNINMILAIAWPFNKIQEWFEGVVTDMGLSPWLNWHSAKEAQL